MGKRILTGSFVALITPFADDGSVDIVQRLGLAEQYGYRVRKDLIGVDAPGEPVGTSVPASAGTGSAACFIR
jgi:hypothetical protein